jgi:hypothetical protein
MSIEWSFGIIKDHTKKNYRYEVAAAKGECLLGPNSW